MNRKRIYPDLRTWRDDLGFTQREAAKFLELSQPVYCRIERQERAPKPLKAKAMSEKAGVPLESILGIA